MGHEQEEILLAGGRVIDPATGVDRPADIVVRGPLIHAVAEPGSITAAGGRTVDCSGKWIVPGLVDMHVHLREPGQEYKEDIASGCLAAAAGGFTAVACMPNTVPVNDCAAVTRFILDKAQGAYARVYPVAAISMGSAGVDLTEMGDLQQAGAVAVSDDGRPVMDSRLMRRALEYAGDYSLTVISHAEDSNLSRGGVIHEGKMATRLGLKGIPAAAEAVMVERDIRLAALTGRPVHIAHVSTKESVAAIRQGKKEGVAVTAETAPHYFTLTHEAVAGYDTHAKMNPPLREHDDVAAIRQALADGTLDAIATDHAPHSSLEKEVEFDVAAFGIIGLQTALPLALELVRREIITPSRLVELLSINPARILRVPGGTLAQGASADITVVDPEKRFVLEREMIRSKSWNTPFLGRELQGCAVCTICNGRITYQN